MQSSKFPTSSKLIHDDRLISAALVAHFDQLQADGHLRLGHSAIIPTPLDNLTWP